MPFSKEMRINPHTITAFIRNYDLKLTKGETVREYARYLTTNENIHHYEGMTQLQWFFTQVNNYCK